MKCEFDSFRSVFISLQRGPSGCSKFQAGDVTSEIVPFLIAINLKSGPRSLTFAFRCPMVAIFGQGGVSLDGVSLSSGHSRLTFRGSKSGPPTGPRQKRGFICERNLIFRPSERSWKTFVSSELLLSPVVFDNNKKRFSFVLPDGHREEVTGGGIRARGGLRRSGSWRDRKRLL